ncbi:MAG: PilZ domain-containing protein [Solirubrobacterales bacterium]
MPNQDRRIHARVPAQTLFIEIDGQPHALIDISAGGVAFEAHGLHPGQVVLALIRSVLDEQDFAVAHCRIIQVCGCRASAAFVDPKLPLLRFVIGHIGNMTGVEPHLLKRSAGA